jgi:cytochrome c peroxidase
LSDADFAAAGVGVSVAEKLAELGRQLAEERGEPTPVELLPLPADRERATLMPFRGNPSDVALAQVGAEQKLYVPLGGDLSTPGNEVAVVGLGDPPQLRTRIAVGIRPQQVAVDPAGLVYVCNQYSNYLSVIDAASDALLVQGGEPVTLATEFHCTDLALVPPEAGSATPDRRKLYVANRFRQSVLAYQLELVRDDTGKVIDVRQDPVGPVAEITRVGASPSRLVLDADSGSLYVLSWRGGDVARIDLATDDVAATFAAGAPAVDLARVGERVWIPTTMPDRGLLAADEAQVAAAVSAAPLLLAGLDGASHEVHPGALFDGTKSYNFEDVRNGLFELDAGLGGAALYYTDDISAEPSFAAERKLLSGALPQALIRNAAGDRLYLAHGGTDQVEELAIEAGPTLRSLRSFATRERPFALALDETRGELFVASWGGEVLEVFELAGGTKRAEVDLGYAEPRYPATSIERGERHFYDAAWSNNGRKTCAHCHYDELLSDGVPFANGATAPTMVHRVKPNHNLGTTDAYFWNGSFANGSYDSLAFAAQSRVNCELVLFGMIEGPASAPETRVGDPNNRFTDGRDADCRPQPAAPGALPANFDVAPPGGVSIASVIAAQKQVAEAGIVAATGLSGDELSRLIDLYSVAELRLAPNPDHQLRERAELAQADLDQLAQGEALFGSAGCVGCHTPDNPRHPFSNGGNQGRGSDWAFRFAERYTSDPRLLAALPGGLPQIFLDGVRTQSPSPEINVHLDPVDFFTPFCFTGESCFAFEDPLETGIDAAEETRRLELLVRFQLADPQRGFVPGNVRGQPSANVPSLRGVWSEVNLLHHGLARSIREAVLAPGHPALLEGERGFAIDRAGELDRHGFTSALTPAEVEALVRFVRSIE